MRIGFSTIYSWRPHVEHMYYLSRLAQEAGHSIAYLTCDSDLNACYTKELRPSRPDWVHCGLCRIGGIRSYASTGVSSLGAHANIVQAPCAPCAWSGSSASTLGRFESDADYASPGFKELAQRLDPSARLSYAAARRWIERERLDAVCVFNGRIDATRGILEACSAAGVPFASMERTWFGDGIQLLPNEGCLGLHSVNDLVARYTDVPLTKVQALRAAAHIAARFLTCNIKEWASYNLRAELKGWPPIRGPRRLLFLPGSRNEVWGDSNWNSGWREHSEAFDAIIDHLKLKPFDLVLRCHPNWAEKIGRTDGRMCEKYYTDWAHRRGIYLINSADSTSTLGLIEEADAVVVCGGTAGLDAGILGKQVIAVSPSFYQHANFESKAYTREQLERLRLAVDLPRSAQAAEAVRVQRNALRFCHTMAYRVPQFVRYVRSVTPTRFRYLHGADPSRLTDLLVSGILKADDSDVATDVADEDVVLAEIQRRAWAPLLEGVAESVQDPDKAIARRGLLRAVDRIRDARPRGGR